MDIFVLIGWLILGLVLLYFGAEWLVRGSSQIALKMGISPLVVGLTVVAFGTSAPELLVSVQANMQTPPQGDLAIGNIVGSNICNIALILGVGALLSPLRIHTQVVRRELPILFGASVVFVLMLWDRQIARWEAAILAVGIVTYVWTSLRMARKESAEEGAASCDEISDEDVEAAQSGGMGRVFINVGLIVIGLLTLVLGADRLIFGGVGIAKMFGVSEVIIGLTLVAFGTSLPELATSVVAALKGEGDIITGNALGSCIFNIMAVIGISGMIAPLSANSVSMIDLTVMLAVVVLVFFFMWSRKRLSRTEGFILLGIYFGYTAWLFLGV